MAVLEVVGPRAEIIRRALKHVKHVLYINEINELGNRQVFTS